MPTEGRRRGRLHDDGKPAAPEPVSFNTHALTAATDRTDNRDGERRGSIVQRCSWAQWRETRHVSAKTDAEVVREVTACIDAAVEKNRRTERIVVGILVALFTVGLGL